MATGLPVELLLVVVVVDLLKLPGAETALKLRLPGGLIVVAILSSGRNVALSISRREVACSAPAASSQRTLALVLVPTPPSQRLCGVEVEILPPMPSQLLAVRNAVVLASEFIVVALLQVV